MDREMCVYGQSGFSDLHPLSGVTIEPNCFGFGQRNHAMPSGTGRELSRRGLGRQGNAAAVTRWLHRRGSGKMKQTALVEPLPSDVIKACPINTLPIVKEEDKLTSVDMPETVEPDGSCSDSIRSLTDFESDEVGAGRVTSPDTERGHAKSGGVASGCSGCFGRAISSTARGIHAEETAFSSHHRNSPGLRFKKGKDSLRKFSCISSRDILPSVTSRGAAQNHLSSRGRGIQGGKQKKEVLNRMRHGRNVVVSTVGCLGHRNSRNGLGTSSLEQGAVTEDSLPSGSLMRTSSLGYKAGKWCLMRPTIVHSETLLEGNLGRTNSARHVSRSISESHDTSPRSSVDEESFLQTPAGESSRRLGFSGRDSAAMYIDRRNTTRLWVDAGLSNSPVSSVQEHLSGSSSSATGQSSVSRTSRIPIVNGVSQRTRSLEAISSPSSITSSPDLHLRNSEVLRSYASTFQSPNSGRAVSSPEYEDAYHVQSVRTPVYRPLRHFPMRRFENEECFTFEGFSEILSTREHVERDEIAYEQVYMFETNLFLSGLPSYDLHRDLRLDIDNMSYEDLLALEESIGNVCTGLGKDAIARCLKSRKYSCSENAGKTISQDIEVKCSICQEDFTEGANLGMLECGHSHHFACIEQWLLQKNLCPICKASAGSRSVQ